MRSILRLASEVYGVFSDKDLLYIEKKLFADAEMTDEELLRTILEKSNLKTEIEGVYTFYRLQDNEISKLYVNRGAINRLSDDRLGEFVFEYPVSSHYEDLFSELKILLKTDLLVEAFMYLIYFNIQLVSPMAINIFKTLDYLGVDYSANYDKLEKLARDYVDNMAIWTDYGQVSMD